MLEFLTIVSSAHLLRLGRSKGISLFYVTEILLTIIISELMEKISNPCFNNFDISYGKNLPVSANYIFFIYLLE